ncbi:MAG: tRNA (adenosine(37)-N6)-threonylcarbamoyltransferase complex ATPase subunit type 1 TsaE [Candidatus Paceibacteria bacterium]
METLLYTQTDLSDIAKKLLMHASEGSVNDRATILALTGNLGAGKTTLVQELARTMEVAEQITSPTFVVMKRYSTKHPVFSELVHIDAYRIEDENEMLVLGFLEWIKNPQALICVEWPEKISSLVPVSAIPISLEVVDEKTRKITYG